MKSLLEKIARLGNPISAKILRFGYDILDGFFQRTEFCMICGLPISRDGKHKTPWAEAEILNLRKRKFYLYPICKHCRTHEPWDKIYEAYSRCWTELYRKTDKLEFNWLDVLESLQKDKEINGAPGDIPMWRESLKQSYKKAPYGISEYCGLKKDHEIPELLEAAREFEKKGILIIVKDDKRTSIRFIKNGKRKKQKEQEVIILPYNKG